MNDFEDLSVFKEMILVGDKQLQAGLGVLYSKDLLDKITKTAFANSKNGKEIDPHIKY